MARVDYGVFMRQDLFLWVPIKHFPHHGTGLRILYSPQSGRRSVEPRTLGSITRIGNAPEGPMDRPSSKHSQASSGSEPSLVYSSPGPLSMEYTQVSYPRPHRVYPRLLPPPP